MSTTIGSSSNLPSQPIFQGTLYKNKKKDMLQLAQGNDLLIQAEILTRRGVLDKAFTKTQKITYFDTHEKANKTVYVKVKTVTSPLLGSKGKKALNDVKELIMLDSLNKQRAANLQELVEVLPRQTKSVVSAPPPPVPAELEALSDRIDEKMEQLKDIEIRVPSSQTVEIDGKIQKVRENSEPLNDYVKMLLIAQIEENKEAWLAEADAKGSWITKKIPYHDENDGIDKIIKIEIFPSDRENVKNLGRIDIRMDYIDKGSFKKVFKSLNYEVGKVTAGIYGPTANVKGDVDSEKALKSNLAAIKSWAETHGWDKVKKKIALSKAHDMHLKTTKNNEVQLKSKLTQPLMQDTLYNVFLTGILPNGQRLDEKTKIQLMVSAFESLEQLHFLGKVHADIKPENLMIIEKNGEYEVRLIDYGLSSNMDEKGVLKGTPNYIAPELLSGAVTTGAIYTAATDIYAMGVAFANMGVTDEGEVAVGTPDIWWQEAQPATRDNIVARVLNAPTFSAAADRKPYPRLGEGAGYSPEFQRGLNMMTNFFPHDRFQSATEAKEYFQDLLNRMP